MSLNRRQFLATLAASPLAAQTAPKKPNIIFILADDLGYGDLGCYGQKQILTPRLDRMAAEGVRFTQAYSGSTVCAPSRCCLITGKHTGHARVRSNGSSGIRSEDVTVSEVLKKAGYRTGLVGKWSLGGIYSPGYPTAKGFDEWFGYFNQSHAHHYYPDVLLDGNKEYMVRENFSEKGRKYSHDLFTERALKFLENEDPRPFFLHICYTIPHANNERGRAMGDGMEVPSDQPYTNKDWPQVEKNFAAMITRMDGDVGKILDLLRKRGIERDTLVIFSSDNGPHKEGGHDSEFFNSSGPLRGTKRDLYEGGVRVPTLAWWPGTLKPNQVSDQTWAFWDFLPTAAELAGAPIPPGLDGVSIAPLLRGRQQKNSQPYLYWEFGEQGFKQAVRMGEWKAVRFGLDGPIELYHLKEDLGEKKNVAAQAPDVVKKIEAILRAARTDSPDMPTSARPRRKK